MRRGDWTLEEEKKVIELRKWGHSLPYTARCLNRTTASVQNKIYRDLKIEKEVPIKKISERDLGLLEGLIDGEGSLYLTKNENRWVPYLTISNTNLTLLEKVKEIIGFGWIRKLRNVQGRRTIWSYNATSGVLRALLPKVRLIVKEKQRQLILEACDFLRDQMGAGHYSKHNERLENIQQQLKELNKRGI